MTKELLKTIIYDLFNDGFKWDCCVYICIIIADSCLSYTKYMNSDFSQLMIKKEANMSKINF